MDSRMVLQKSPGIPSLEFKSEDDNAWYEAFIHIREPSELYIRFKKFPKSHDQILSLEKFKTREDVRSRIRVSAEQLQDAECIKVREKMVISASCSTDGKDLKFYNAVVEEIIRSNHLMVNGAEECTCRFKVLWQDGPKENQRTYISCENVCLLSTRSIDDHPKIKALFKLSGKKFNSNVPSPVQEVQSTLYPGFTSIRLTGTGKNVEKRVLDKENVVTNPHCASTSHYALGDGIMLKDERPCKIPRLEGESYICSKDSVPAAATAASLSYLSLSNANSHSEITQEAPFDPKILREWENENNFNYMNLNMQMKSQTDCNKVEKEPTVRLFGFNLLSKEIQKQPLDFDLNVDLNLSDEETVNLDLKLSYEKTNLKKAKTIFPFEKNVDNGNKDFWRDWL